MVGPGLTAVTPRRFSVGRREFRACVRSRLWSRAVARRWLPCRRHRWRRGRRRAGSTCRTANVGGDGPRIHPRRIRIAGRSLAKSGLPPRDTSAWQVHRGCSATAVATAPTGCLRRRDDGSGFRTRRGGRSPRRRHSRSTGDLRQLGRVRPRGACGRSAFDPRVGRPRFDRRSHQLDPAGSRGIRSAISGRDPLRSRGGTRSAGTGCVPARSEGMGPRRVATSAAS